MRNFIWLFVIIIICIVVSGLLYLLNATGKSSRTAFVPQQTKLYLVSGSNNHPITVLATTLPQFAVSLADQKFRNLWMAHAAERQGLVGSSVVGVNGENLKAETKFDETKRQVVITPQSSNDFKPGLYKLNVKVKTYDEKDITITQDFTWGVLAINTGKAVYQPGETVKIGMGVLDDKGNTKCIADGDIIYQTAKVWLTITSPSGNVENLSTDNGTIIGSRECAATSITNNPDFQTQTRAHEVGKYLIHMTAQNINGTRSIDDSFTVITDPQPFIIMRTSYPTRIYPYGHYPVEITVIANQDYTGKVSDFVPSNFTISNISNGGTANKVTDYQQIDWQVDFRQGQTYKLTYEIKFPPISPEFYLVGPLTIGQYTEGREWQIASDAVSLVQSTSNVVASGTTVSATLGSLTANNFLVLICSTTSSASINTQARNGGFTWNTNTGLYVSVATAPHIRMQERRIKSGDSSTLTCSFGSSTGVKAIQLFEYSGIATSSFLDATGKLNPTTNNCNSSPFQATASLTATNGNELVISSHVATGTRSVNSHSTGFTQEFAFNGSTGTFTSADQVITDAGAYSDTVTFSGSAGNCAAVIGSFVTPVTMTQNGYRFFQNADSATPGSPIDAQNTDITLPIPHDPFRLRMFIDIDGNQTQSAGALTYILQYAQAPVSGNCSTLTDADWNPVTSTTPIAWNVNPSSGGSGTSIVSSGNDPTETSPHAYTTRLEDYYESFTGDGSDDVSNLQLSIGNAQAGLWDFSLIDNTDDTQSTTYCLELVHSDSFGGFSGDLDSYLHYPKVTTFYNEVNIKSGSVIKSGTVIN